MSHKSVWASHWRRMWRQICWLQVLTFLWILRGKTDTSLPVSAKYTIYEVQSVTNRGLFSMGKPTTHVVLPFTFPLSIGFSEPLDDGFNPHDTSVHLAHKHNGTNVRFLGVIRHIPSNGPQLSRSGGDCNHGNGHCGCDHVDHWVQVNRCEVMSVVPQSPIWGQQKTFVSVVTSAVRGSLTLGRVSTAATLKSVDSRAGKKSCNLSASVAKLLGCHSQ